MRFWSLLVAVFLAMPVWAQEGVQVVDPWIRAAPPGVPSLAAYMTLKNPDPQEKVVVGAHSPFFAKVEMHESMQHNGMTMMHSREKLSIPSGGQVQLAPGGLHLMLITPQKALRPLDLVPITLQFADGGQVALQAEVRAVLGGRDQGAGGDHQHAGH